MKTHGPYVIRHMDHNTYWEAAPAGQMYGAWRTSAAMATTFATKQDAQRAISGMRVDRYGKSRCQIILQAECMRTLQPAAQPTNHSSLF